MQHSSSGHSLDVRVRNPWQTLEPRVAWRNDRLAIREDAVVQPDGKQGTYTFVETSHSVVAVVRTTATTE